MRVSLFSTAVLLLTLIAAGTSALACDCMTPPEPECFKEAELVFEGEVVLVLYNKQYPQTPIGYVFRVINSFKGKPDAEVMIFGTGFNCDASFIFGGVYRVYAAEFQGKMRSGICSGNQFLYQKRTLFFGAQSSSGSFGQLWYVKAAAVLSIGALLTLMFRYARTRVFIAKG